ncbi:sugar phosphate isomerase/epimerase family protein [Bosea sp. NPDC055332]
MRPISLAHLTVLDADPVGLIEAAQAGGFDAVGLRVIPPLATDTITEIVGDAPLQRRIRRALAATGLSVLDIEAVWLQPQTDVAALRPALELGAELGARHVLTVGFDAEHDRLVDSFGTFCALAHDCGLCTMLEFIPYATIGTLAAAHELLLEARPANAGLLVDALHLSRAGGHPRDIATYDPALFSYIHLCDAAAAVPPPDQLRSEARGGRAYPGEGQLWLGAFLDAFPPETPIGVEAPNIALAGLPPAMRARRAGDATRELLRRRSGQEANGEAPTH